MCHPISYSDECSFGSCQLVFAIGFVSVDEKSVTRNSHDGPGDKLEQLILRFCNAKTELVVQDTQLKTVIESKLVSFYSLNSFPFIHSNQIWHSNVDIVSQDVKCWTGDQVVEDVIWGLKYVMPHFIVEERNKITNNYFLPLSKQMLEDLEAYGINVPASEVFLLSLLFQCYSIF
jgi:hypothetical protein